MQIKLILSFFIIVLLIGCSKEPAQDRIVPQPENILECGTDASCFTGSLTNCNPAKYIIQSNQTRLEVTIKGKDQNNCVVHYLAAETPIEPLKNTEMHCWIPQEGYTPEQYESFFQENLMDICEGTYKDTLQSLLNP